MMLEPFQSSDIGVFLELAAAEGWVADPWEFAFLLDVFPKGCLCMRDGTGRGVAFVTALRHERSGWIGNLIVAEGFRGKGLGEALFRKALEALRTAGVRTFWLTASEMGRSLYERYGFSSIDSIIRWVGTGRQRHPSCGRNIATLTVPPPSVIVSDSRSWGDRRELLLAAVMNRGRALSEESGFVVVQPCSEALQLGPFSARDSATAEVLLEAALRMVPLGRKVFLDAPLSNRSALRMYNRKGMRIAGRNALMYAGDKPDYRPEMLYGLATMGSCG